MNTNFKNVSSYCSATKNEHGLKQIQLELDKTFWQIIFNKPSNVNLYYCIDNHWYIVKANGKNFNDDKIKTSFSLNTSLNQLFYRLHGEKYV